ncbi:hypothetical protein ACFXI3_18430 [Amycolatopsis sp. NPDC059235]|uniref:phage major capsid protein n=1 Tax=Amycolatopsis sp. NPDC059235 TaxID=3346782 RepID=UPI00366D30D2
MKDSWSAHKNFDSEARDRLLQFEAQTKGIANQVSNAMFAANATNAAAVVPLGYRPDLYVAQLMKGRPLAGGISHGSLADTSLFTIPSFTSSDGMTSQHTEGTNPAGGTLTLGTVTVKPKAISGTFQVTREAVGSSNPAIARHTAQAMGESYSRQTEEMVFTELNRADGQGDTVTNRFVPSGAQASTSTSTDSWAASGRVRWQGTDCRRPARRGAAPVPPVRRAVAGYLSQEGTPAFVTAVDSDGFAISTRLTGQDERLRSPRGEGHQSDEGDADAGQGTS